MTRRDIANAAKTIEHVEVVTYARYSCDKQNERSIEDQERACADVAARLGLPAPKKSFHDAARSGASIEKRDGLQELLVHASQPAPRGTKRVIVIEALDRLGRNLFDSFDIVRRLHRENGCRLVTVDGRDSDAPAFKMMLLADSFVADVFLDTLKAKTKRGLEGRVLAGRWVCQVPYGYRMDDGRLVVEPEAAAVVRRLFDLAAAGVSARGIAAQLNRAAVRAPKQGRWSQRAVACRLTKRIYVGEVWWDGKLVRTDEALRLVPGDVWERAQTAREVRAKAAPRQGNLLVGGSSRRSHLISGLLRCTSCGTPLAIAPGGRWPTRWYYGCPHHYARGGCSNQMHVPGPSLEDAVVGAVLETVIDERAISFAVRAFQRRIAASSRGHETERKRAERDLTDVRRRLANCVDHVERFGASALIQAKIRELETDERRLAERLAVLQKAAPKIEVLRSAVEGYLRRAAESLRSGDRGRLRAALAQVVTDGTVERIARGEYRVRFRVLPLGVLREFTIPDVERPHRDLNPGYRRERPAS